MPRIPTAPARTLPVPAGTTASGVARPISAVAASRTVPSPPTTTTSRRVRRLGQRRAGRLERVRLDPRLRPEPMPDRADDRRRDPLALGRIDDPRRPRIDQDQRGGRGRPKGVVTGPMLAHESALA